MPGREMLEEHEREQIVQPCTADPAVACAAAGRPSPPQANDGRERHDWIPFAGWPPVALRARHASDHVLHRPTAAVQRENLPCDPRSWRPLLAQREMVRCCRWSSVAKMRDEWSHSVWAGDPSEHWRKAAVDSIDARELRSDCGEVVAFEATEC
jgi:hypothetical protein